MNRHICQLIVLLALPACGSASESGGGTRAPTKPTPTSLAVADATALPACDADHDQQLVYLMAEKEFQTCQAGAWAVIDVSGTPGKDGANGKDGTAGKAGSDGTSNVVASQFECYPQLTALEGVDFSAIKIIYRQTTMTSGDTWVLGGFRSDVEESDLVIFKNGDSKQKLGTVGIQSNFYGANAYGVWAIGWKDETQKQLKVLYIDSDLPTEPQREWTFNTDAGTCNTN